MVRFSHLMCLVVLALVIVDALDDKQQKGEFEEEKIPDEKVATYELKSDKMYAKFTNWGATLMSFRLPDRDGKMADVVLGYDSVDNYKNDTVYFGATVGRVANRISGAHFNVGSHVYHLEANEGNHTLHGGPRGFSDVVWRMDRLVNNKSSKPSITFSYKSSDGEEGFPGVLRVKVKYTLNPKKNSMTIQMTGKPGSNVSTPVNLANHAYWNLGGHDSGDILSHTVQIFGSRITPVDDELIPTGKLQDVNGTAYDFLTLSDIRSKMHGMPKGYDINYALDNAGVNGNNSNTNTREDDDAEVDSKVDNKGKVKSNGSKRKQLHRAAVVEDPASGRRMELSTNQPGLQFYTSGGLSEVKGKNGTVYRKFGGLCLETQGFPDSVNHPNFPSQIVRPGEAYKHVMELKFSAVVAS